MRWGNVSWYLNESLVPLIVAPTNYNQKWSLEATTFNTNNEGLVRRVFTIVANSLKTASPVHLTAVRR